MKNTELTPLCLTLLCITIAIIVPVLNAPSTLAQAYLPTGPSNIRDSTILAKLPNQDSSQYSYMCTNCMNAIEGQIENAVTIQNINSRDELINSVSSYNQLHEILGKFKDFIDATAFSGNHNPLTSNKTTIQVPVRQLYTPDMLRNDSINVYYSWYPRKVIRENNSILMLRFTNSSGEPITNGIDYTVTITNGDKFNFQKNGSTTTGVDMKTIGKNTFPLGSVNKPIYYDMSIKILAISGTSVLDSPDYRNTISSSPSLKVTVL